MATTVDIAYLLPYLRLRIGDTNPASYRYVDSWLTTSLVISVRSLGKYWSNKYEITDLGIVNRNSIYTGFYYDESMGVIEPSDEDIIVIQAAIIILEGSLENSAWDVVSWRDNEISFSNLESARQRSETLNRLIARLNDMVLPPTKRLAVPTKQSLPGYLNNLFENSDK